MKKRKGLIILSSALLLAVPFLSSCDTTGVVEALTYKVSYASAEGATVSLDKEEAAVGDTVTATVTVTDVSKVVDVVKANALVLGSSGSGAYAFTMPAEDVVISVTLKDAPKESTYGVTLPSSEEYTVHADKVDNLVVGEEVTLTVELAEGVAGVKFVKAVKAGDVVLAANDDEAYVFTMPAKNVEVTVELADVEVEATYSLTLPTDTTEYTVAASKTTGIVPGEVVSITVTLAESVVSTKFVKSVTVGGQVLAADSEGKFVFAMPANDVNASVELATYEVPVTFALTLPEETDEVAVTATKTVDISAGEGVTLTVTNKVPDTKFVASVKVNEAAIAAGADGLYAFAMPAADATVTVVLEEVSLEGIHSLVLPEATDEVAITADKVENIDVGTKVTLNVEVLDTKKIISSLKVNGDELVVTKDTSGTEEEGFTSEKYVATFFMPDEDATVAVVLEDDPTQIEYALTITATGTWETYFKLSFQDQDWNTITSAKVGTTVKVMIEDLQDTSNVQYDIDDFKMNSNRIEFSSMKKEYNSNLEKYVYTYAFVVTSDGATITSFYKASHKFTINIGGDSGYVTFYNLSSTAASDESVYLYPRIKYGYTLNSIAVTDASGTAVALSTLTESSSSSNGYTTPTYYKFSMPASNATITVDVVGAPFTIAVETDTYAVVSNFRQGSQSDIGDSKVIGSGTVDNYAFVASFGSYVYFDVTTSDTENYMISTVQYTVDGTTYSDVWTSSSSYYLKMPSSNVKIVVTTKRAKAPLTITDTEHLNLKAYVEGTESGTYVELTDTIPAAGTRLYLKAEEISSSEDGSYMIDTVYFNGDSEYTSKVGDYLAFWVYDSDIEPEGNTLTITEKYYEAKFAGSAFLGTYTGCSFGSSSSTQYFAVDKFGRYSYTSTESSVYDYKSTLLTLGDDGKTLTDSSYTFIYQNGWIIKKDSSLSNTVIMKQGSATQDLSNGAYASSSADSKYGVVRFNLGETTYRAIADLTNNVFYTDLVATVESGSAFKSGGIVTLADSNGKTVKTLKFTGSSKFDAVDKDTLGGTYTSDGTGVDEGSLVLDGYGGVTIGTLEGTYTVAEDGKTITVLSTNYQHRKKVFVLNSAAKTYYGNNAVNPFFSTSTTYSYKAEIVASDGNTYDFVIKFDEEYFYIYAFLHNEDGSVNDTSVYISSYNTIRHYLFDGGAGTLVYRILSGEDSYVGGGSSLVATLSSSDLTTATLTVSATLFPYNGSNPVFTLDNTVLTLVA